ncbi:hypothetical protein EV702DRAFT_1199042 [Suillus placidus]|uniref:Uncharacterized protein n=1 Tax=Suillus placidus TaxID=48579 RepID=A0A9P6ZS84_9AGAM|nr:hypothetical protein EV702DRAFT_1199042 [Suillus placidus]
MSLLLQQPLHHINTQLNLQLSLSDDHYLHQIVSPLNEILWGCCGASVEWTGDMGPHTLALGANDAHCNPPTDPGRVHLSHRFLRHVPLAMVEAIAVNSTAFQDEEKDTGEHLGWTLSFPAHEWEAAVLHFARPRLCDTIFFLHSIKSTPTPTLTVVLLLIDDPPVLNDHNNNSYLQRASCVSLNVDAASFGSMDHVCVELEIERSVALVVNENTLAGPVTAQMTQNDESLTPQQDVFTRCPRYPDVVSNIECLRLQLPDLVPYPSIDPQYYSMQPSPTTMATEYTAHPYPDATMDMMMVLNTPSSYASDSDRSSSSTPDKTTHPKCKVRQDSEAVDRSSSLALPPTTSKRRHIDNEKIGEGTFSAYTSANASATVMPVPHFNPKPVDISGRRTHDDNSEVLRTRKYGVMELDDSYSNWPCQYYAGITCRDDVHMVM